MAEFRINQLKKIGKKSLADGPLTVGRSHECTIVLPHSSVSREHCVIENVNGVTRIRDLGSTHGTRLNGRPITEADIYDQDVITLGRFELTYSNPEAIRPDHLAGASDGPAFGQPVEIDLTGPDDSDVDLTLEEAECTGDRIASVATPAGDADARELRRLTQRIEELTSQLAAREQELAGVGMREDEVQAKASTQAARIETLETELAETRATTEQTISELQANGAALEAERDAARRECAKAQTELERTTASMTETAQLLQNALEQIATLKKDADDAHVAAREARRHVDSVENLLGTLRGEAQQVFAASKKLTTIQQGLQALETVYVETNEWAEIADESDPEAYEQALSQQEAVGAQLEGVHAQRDEATEQLQQMVEHFCRTLIANPEYQPAPPEEPKRGMFSRLTRS